MDWITPEVAIGNYREARDSQLLQRASIQCIISLDGTASPGDAKQFGLIEVAQHRLIDGAGNDPRVFEVALANLERMVTSHPPVLVQCHAGRSRSVVLVAAYLMRAKKIGPEAALALVASKREISVTAGLVNLLRQFPKFT